MTRKLCPDCLQELEFYTPAQARYYSIWQGRVHNTCMMHSKGKVFKTKREALAHLLKHVL